MHILRRMQCAISLTRINSVNHAIFKVICLFYVTTFHFLVIISGNLSVSNEKNLVTIFFL